MRACSGITMLRGYESMIDHCKDQWWTKFKYVHVWMVEVVREIDLWLRINFTNLSYERHKKYFWKLIVHTLDDHVVEIEGWQKINDQGSFCWWKSAEDKRAVDFRNQKWSLEKMIKINRRGWSLKYIENP